MNRYVLAVLLLVVTPGTLAQQGLTRLQCDGQYSNFDSDSDTRGLEIHGGYLDVSKETVKFVSIVGFATTYDISFENETTVCFVLQTNKFYSGLSRLS